MGMDRTINSRTLSKPVLKALGTGVVFTCVGTFLLFSTILPERSLSLAENRLNIAKTVKGTFEDYIPLRVRAVPLKSVFLDAVQGGRVENVLVEDGATIKAGQVLLTLSNADLQLSVMSTESRVMEQLNTMRDQELRLEQNRLNHKRRAIELQYNIDRLNRDIKRKKTLVSQNHISQSEFDTLLDELHYLKNMLSVTRESQASDERLMSTQLDFFKEKTINMEENLAFARKSLQDLTVRAPVSGSLSGFDLEVGQNVPRGERIGQISSPQFFKLTATIDEYYLGRIDLGQQATFEQAREVFQAQIVKIYPTVKNGQFRVDLNMTGNQPATLRRGQTIQAKLTLGSSNQALLVPNGPFFQDTGGQWIFVLNEKGSQAHRRSIQLGRRNNRFIEVLSGLNAGDAVITSSYSSFKDMELLKLEN